MTAVIAVIALSVMFFLLEYFMYRYTFGRSKRRESGDYKIPSGAQYTPFKEAIHKNIERALSFDSERISIISHDGLKLSARYYNNGGNGRLAIFFHGYRSSAVRDGNGIIQICHDNGYDILVVDQRAHGKSEGKTITFGIKEREDCLKWVDFAVSRFGVNVKIALIGLSMGAATVMMAADRLPENVKCIIEDCGYVSPRDILQSVIKRKRLPCRLIYPLVRLSAVIFGGFNPDSFSAAEALAKASVPVLMIHGEADLLVPCLMCNECGKACASETTTLLVPNAGHAMSYYYNNEGYVASVCSFLHNAFL